MTIATPLIHRPLASRHRQRGASLLEGIAYLGIAALVVLGAVSLLQNAFGSARANQTMEEVVALRTNIRKMYSGQAYNDATMQANMVNARAIPATLPVAAGVISNPFGGVVTLAGPSATTFTVTYTQVPQDVCANTVSGSTGWTRIAGAADATPIAAFPATAALAAALCAAATNTIVFTAN